MCDSTCMHCTSFGPAPKADKFWEVEARFLAHLQKHGVSVDDCKWCVTRDRAKGASR